MIISSNHLHVVQEAIRTSTSVSVEMVVSKTSVVSQHLFLCLFGSAVE